MPKPIRANNYHQIYWNFPFFPLKNLILSKPVRENFPKNNSHYIISMNLCKYCRPIQILQAHIHIQTHSQIRTYTGAFKLRTFRACRAAFIIKIQPKI